MASGGPARPAGVPFIMASPGPAGLPAGSGSWTTPGEIALTRTPAGPNSAAQARVSVSIAPLVELYSAPTGMPSRAIHEPRLKLRWPQRAI
jgi:hypothetical protein